MLSRSRLISGQSESRSLGTRPDRQIWPAGKKGTTYHRASAYPGRRETEAKDDRSETQYSASACRRRFTDPTTSSARVDASAALADAEVGVNDRRAGGEARKWARRLARHFGRLSLATWPPGRAASRSIQAYAATGSVVTGVTTRQSGGIASLARAADVTSGNLFDGESACHRDREDRLPRSRGVGFFLSSITTMTRAIIVFASTALAPCGVGIRADVAHEPSTGFPRLCAGRGRARAAPALPERRAELRRSPRFDRSSRQRVLLRKAAARAAAGGGWLTGIPSPQSGRSIDRRRSASAAQLVGISARRC